jgi:glyoxylase-like metal-dependent hydrolase (beta-lactamase superfamily II)
VPAIHPVVDEGLGNSAYVVELGDGRALVVDPACDPTPELELPAGGGCGSSMRSRAICMPTS